MTSTIRSRTDKKFTSWRVYLRLLRYVRAHWFMFSLNVLGFMLFAATQPMLAKLTEYLITLLEGNTGEAAAGPVEEGSSVLPVVNVDLSWFTNLMPSMSDSVMMIPIYVVIIYLLRGIGLFVGNYAMAVVAENVVHTLRTQMFEKLTSLPSAYFDGHGSGELISKLTYNVAQVTIAATDALKTIMREGFTVVLVLGYLFWTNWKLTMIFVAIAPVIAGLVAIAGKRLRRISGRLQTAMGSITAISSEMIGGYRVMRSFGGEDYEQQRFRKASRYTYTQNVKMVFTANLASSINQLLVAIALGVLLLIALRFIGQDGAGELVGYMVAVGMLPKCMRHLSEVYGKIQKGLVAAHSVFEQLDESPEQDSGTLDVERVVGKVEFRDLTFRYPNSDEPTLRNINLKVEPGTTVALVGRSGSGKTTMVSLLPRYYDYQNEESQHSAEASQTGGGIFLDDHEITDYTLESLRRQVALVTQNVVLFNDTIYNNIAYGELANRSREDVIAATRHANALEFIEKLPEGFDTIIGEDGARLSGGQRQRLSIARAFLKDAPLLILDEATSALDNESEKLIQDALEKVIENRTTFVIAHRLSTIENADMIVVMDQGRIAEIGTHSDLLQRNGAYAKLHDGQFQDS